MACKKRCRTDERDDFNLLFDDETINIFDDETNNMFDDVCLNIFDYIEPVITDTAFKCQKCIDDILIHENKNEYGCLDCRGGRRRARTE